MGQRRIGRPYPLVGVSYSEVPRPAASVSPGSLLDMQILCPTPDQLNQKLGWVLDLSPVKVKIRVRRVRQDWTKYRVRSCLYLKF